MSTVRIVGGVARGRRLAVPPAGTRPTSDRAREGLFNALGSLVDLDGAHALDLFAGSGAVGLEALSRGAREVVLVESGRHAKAVLEHNIERVGLPGARIVARPVGAYLADDPETPFDLVFADPPYAFTDDQLRAVLAALAGPDRLMSGAIVVVERSARSAAAPWPDCVTPVRERRYGDAVLWYGRRR